MWRFADDKTAFEIVPKFGASNLQPKVHHVLHWLNANKFKLNSLKWKELHRKFCRKANLDTPALDVNTNTSETVKSGKVQSITLWDDPKWNDHVGNITAKASLRIYLLKPLKRGNIDQVSVIQFYCLCLCSALEYASQAFHASLPCYLSDQIERIKKWALRIVYPPRYNTIILQ